MRLVHTTQLLDRRPSCAHAASRDVPYVLQEVALPDLQAARSVTAVTTAATRGAGVTGVGCCDLDCMEKRTIEVRQNTTQ
jgi:hypothetical protein